MTESTGIDQDGAERARPDAVPNANSPQLLTHLLEMVARGIRSTRGLQEALGVDPRTVRYYVQAGAWLGFLHDGAEPLLTPEGLGYVYAGPERPERYASAVEQQPFVSALLARTGGRPPDDTELERAILRADPNLSPATVARRASSVRGLIAPCLEHRARTAPDDTDHQLMLPLSQAPSVEPAPPLAHLAGRSFSPDIYRYLLCFLLDHGELTLGHVRGLLDRAGAGDVPLGSYVDLALERGDAVRLEERLVVAAGAIDRRDLTSTTSAVILSDDGWRTHLEAIRTAMRQGTLDHALRQEGRWRLWDRRLFGHELDPGTLEADLERVLRDRSLASWPRTAGPAAPMAGSPGVAFLETWQRPDLVVALPPSLVQLWEGVAGVNRRLRNARHRADAVGTPSAAYRPAVVHGGLLHPGEGLPRSVPDQRTLRQRLVMHAPYVALLVAIAYLHRTDAATFDTRHEQGHWVVRRQRVRLGSLLDVVDGFARSRGWSVSRRRHGGMSDLVVVSLLERMGLTVTVGDRLLLDDTFFLQLRQSDEEGILRGHLEPLASALGDWISSLHAPKEATP